MGEPIVVDTSVLISALIGKQGPGREIMRRCFQGKYVPLMSNSLFFEYEDVVTREHIVDLCPLTTYEVRELLNAFYSVCAWTSIYFLWRPNIRDEGDNFLIELAIAGNAPLIVTNNVKDLHSAELNFPNLTIVTPEQILRGK